MKEKPIKSEHCFVILNKKLKRSKIQAKQPLARFDSYVPTPSKGSILRVELDDGTYELFEIVNQYTEYEHYDEYVRISFGIGLKKRSIWAGTGKVILKILNALKP